MNETTSLKVKVLFFGATADVAQTRSTVLEIAPQASSREAFQKVLDMYPRLASHKLLFAVNQAYAQGHESLHEGDELAIFTAVSGG